MIEVSSTKAYLNLPCAHSQYFDKEPDGSPGECASIHGYDRSVKLSFSGNVDNQGWLMPFGELKKVKKFIEYYFDHTTVLPANDERINDIPEKFVDPGGLLATLRVLPYGVSMEMSSLFVWEWVNAFVFKTTSGRAYLSGVESIEHERNSAFVRVDRMTAQAHALLLIRNEKMLPLKDVWQYTSPKTILKKINKGLK